MANTYFNIPHQVSLFVVQNKLEEPCRIWLDLKRRCSGKIFLPVNKQQAHAAELRISFRSYQRHIQVLKSRNWISKSKRSGYFFIISFDRMMKLEGLKGRGGTWLNTQRDLDDKSKFKAYVFAGVMDKITRHQKAKEYNRKKPAGRLKGRPNKPAKNDFSQFLADT